jgi:hypothetical protein
LQLDPDDDEAEQAARMAIEQRAEREVAHGLEEWLRTVFPETMTEAEVADWANRLETGRATFRDVLRRALQDSADLGVSVSVGQLANVGFGFDWTLASTDAAEWASAYSYELVTGITESTRSRLAVAVTEWVNNGDPLPRLIREVAPIFGRDRAAMIAATEVTRAYAEGATAGYRASGVVRRLVWRTARDEIVCPICGALHNQTVGIEERFDGALPPDVRVRFPQIAFQRPPAHPNCRCWLVAEVETV